MCWHYISAWYKRDGPPLASLAPLHVRRQEVLGLSADLALVPHDVKAAAEDEDAVYHIGASVQRCMRYLQRTKQS